MLKLKDIHILHNQAALADLPEGKVLINTINAHSYNVAQRDELFAEALTKGDVLIPDGASIVKACRWIKAKSQPEERVAGWDLFAFEMERLEAQSQKRKAEGEKLEAQSQKLNTEGEKLEAQSHKQNTEGEKLEAKNVSPTGSGRKLKVMFMGSSEKVLSLIRERAAHDYPNLEVVTYSPPYKPEFSDADNRAIIEAINTAQPDLLWIGMTAPKQEKWAYSHWQELHIHCHCGTIGAVFDFYAGTVKRAPLWWQRHSLEWLYRLLKEPRRMWRRYILGNTKFLWLILKEKY